FIDVDTKNVITAIKFGKSAIKTMKTANKAWHHEKIVYPIQKNRRNNHKSSKNHSNLNIIQ
ncbi:hypothetical protein, partial [Bacillus sp. AFS088145]|uniref:hypothetical protein n=1 Tax=Bacillus sp. AFS088145 TaxID=2033514 RepID=UPI000C0194D7